MRISEVATILSLASKDVINEVEGLREDLTGAGHKIAKKLTAASALDDDAVRILMAALDKRRKEALDSQAQAEKERAAHEAEARRREEEERRRKEDEERRKAAEEARRKADEELAKRQERLARLGAIGAGAAPPPAAAAAPPPPPPAAPPVAPPVEVAPPSPAEPIAAGPPPGAPVPGPAPAPAAPPAPRPATAHAGPAPVPGAASAPAPRLGPGQAAPPAGPARGTARGPAGPPQGPRTGPGGYPNARPQGPGGGYQGNRPPGPGGDRGGPRPPAGPRRPGDGPPRSGPGGPGGPGRPRPTDGRPGDNRGPRPDGRPNLEGRPGRSASNEQIADFINQGLQPSISETPRRTRGGKDDRPKEADRGDAARRKRGPGKGAGADAKKFRPTQIFNNEVATRRPSARPSGGKRGDYRRGASRGGPSRPAEPRVVTLSGDFTVGQFADRLGVQVADVIKHLMLMGEMKTMNQVLDASLAELIAAELNVAVNIQPESDESDVEKYLSRESREEDLAPRPPVITVMGHVDHGKTTLLDSIRKANVVSGEAGGITQHIGSYWVETDKGPVVFLDTPGHEAFTEMRARGADCTDIVVLVVAANDGVKPQTVEAINHAKAAGAPIVVAINKIDAEGANPSRVKQELMRFELVAEEFGGDTLMVEISALKGEGVASLLETLALQAEIMELKADPTGPATGVVVESHVDPNRGAVATILIDAGTLHQGDYFVVGTEHGRVRAMMDDKGKALKEAGPARPVEILGLSGGPGAGEQFIVVEDESEARDIAERRLARRKLRAAAAQPHVTLENLSATVGEGGRKSLNLIVKADVSGSVEAITTALRKIKSDLVLLDILHAAAGGVTEGDVQLADASDAIVIAFNVRPDAAARQLAERTGVEIKSYNIIYDLLEEIEAAMKGMLDPVFEEQEMSRVAVKEVFKITKVGNIAGCEVLEGTIGATHHARLVRGGAVIWRGKLSSLRRHKDAAKEVVTGMECGVGLENFHDIKVGDIIETYILNEKEASLVAVQKAGALQAAGAEA